MFFVINCKLNFGHNQSFFFILDFVTATNALHVNNLITASRLASQKVKIFVVVMLLSKISVHAHWKDLSIIKI